MTRRSNCDVVVIGGGPAGLAASTAAAQAGLSVILLDAYARPGGQYFMQSTAASAVFARSWQVREGAASIARAEAVGVRIYSGAEVWAVFPGVTVEAFDENGALEVRASSIIVATGAHDRSIAFPGWTLPGVLTPGAAQRLAKTSGIPPGKRTLLAGSGPFLLPVASAVLKAGGHLVEIVEAQKSLSPLLPLLAVYPEKWAEALRLLKPLAVTRPKRRYGEVVVAARGDGKVEEAELARLDKQGRPSQSERRLVRGIDSLLVGFGFRPQIEFTSILGCDHRYDEASGGWQCITEPVSGATTVSGVFAAGEVTGIGGAEPARISGEIAGLAAADTIGGTPSLERRRRLGRRLRRAARFARFINRRFSIPAGLCDSLTDDTIICRCEDVTVADIKEELDNGARDSLGVKLWTRAGMGPCQGRICQATLMQLVASQTGQSPQEIGFNMPRVPARPVPLSVVRAALADERG